MGIYLVLTVFVTFLMTACAPVGSSTSTSTGVQGSQAADAIVNINPPPPSTIPPVSTTPAQPPVGSSGDGNPAIPLCSKLSFSDVQWNSSMDLEQQSLLQLALNMSGSFEGTTGWINLTNNFDGQGLSMGILNQNFGQGSLQPMWVELYNKNKSTMQTYFSASDFASVESLLKSIPNGVGVSAKNATLNLAEYGYNQFDDPVMVAKTIGVKSSEISALNAAVSSGNQVAVTWAVNNLYSGSSFKSNWSKSLSAMASGAPYRSVQVEKAMGLHSSALSMVKSYGLSQVRSYLFMFDILTQNGGLNSSILSSYKTWLKSNASASETQKLNEILTLRLTTVLSQYRADVSSRKSAIINGTGTVHGASRNFNKEYCTNITQNI